MNILKLFLSRAALAGAATVLLPMAVAAQKAAPAQDVAPEFAKLLTLVLVAVGYCFLALAVGCGSRNDPFCFDMARLGFILMTSGFCIMIFFS
jgi:hypothetical protein